MSQRNMNKTMSKKKREKLLGEKSEKRREKKL
jgi:hypothetical protein